MNILGENDPKILRVDLNQPSLPGILHDLHVWATSVLHQSSALLALCEGNHQSLVRIPPTKDQ